MALATAEDVEGALGRALTESETQRSESLLDEASDLVIGYLGCDPTGDPILDEDGEPTGVNEIPGAVSRVVARMVSRVLSLDTPTGSEGTTETVGPFSKTVRFSAGTTSGAPWLAGSDKITLRPFRCGGGMVPVGLSSRQTGRYRRLP